MRSHTFKLIVLLLGGAIVNVAVAWGAEYFVRVRMWDNKLLRAEQERTAKADWSELRNQSNSYAFTLRGAFSSVGSDVLMTSSTTTFRPGRLESHGQLYSWDSIFWHRDGFPFRALAGEHNGTGLFGLPYAKPVTLRDCHLLNGTINLCQGRDHYVMGVTSAMLPMRPLWPGFAINTVFYAATLWPLFALLVTLHRRRRIKRGLCPACAYPIGTSDVCTECGAAVRVVNR